jgi:sensor histidine kinase YesM
LEQSGQSFISLRNTIDYLHRYMEMEKIRNTHFTYTLNADTALDLDETVLPPMLIQPFIENAIWHGVTAIRKNISIHVSFRKEAGQLVCKVEDDGTGINQSLKNKTANEGKHQSVGISNVKDHIRLLNEKYNLQCSVVIEDKQDIPGAAGTGTLVTLRLPHKLQEE